MSTELLVPTADQNKPALAGPQRLKVALVVHDLHEHGGHSLYTKVLADQLSLRHEVAVFASRSETPADARWNPQRVRAWRGSSLATVHTFPLGLLARKKALSGYDIRHMQGYCGGDPNVVTAHICVAAYLRSLRGVAFRNRLSLQSMARAEARFYRRYRGQVIAVSQKIARELQAFYGVEGEVTVIPHGVDSSRFDRSFREVERAACRKELGIDEDRTVALYVGDLTKAHTYLRELSDAAPATQFIIVTRSRAYHWQRSNVLILPPTNALERYYAAADAFVFPTTYDAFGMVVLEAMASGLAVLCSDQAGAAELLESEKTGFIIPLNEWTEVTSARLADKGLLKTVGIAARASAKQYDWPTVVAAVEKLYLKIASV